MPVHLSRSQHLALETDEAQTLSYPDSSQLKLDFKQQQQKP